MLAKTSIPNFKEMCKFWRILWLKKYVFYVNIGDIRHLKRPKSEFIFLKKTTKIANWRNFAAKNYSVEGSIIGEKETQVSIIIFDNVLLVLVDFVPKCI